MVVFYGQLSGLLWIKVWIVMLWTTIWVAVDIAMETAI